MDLGLKELGLPYWARINFMIYWTWTWKILELLYCILHSAWFYDILDLGLKTARTTLLELDWFYDILDLDQLQKPWTTLLDWDWFCCKLDLDWRMPLCFNATSAAMTITSNLKNLSLNSSESIIVFFLLTLVRLTLKMKQLVLTHWQN